MFFENVFYVIALLHSVFFSYAAEIQLRCTVIHTLLLYVLQRNEYVPNENIDVAATEGRQVRPHPPSLANRVHERESAWWKAQVGNKRRSEKYKGGTEGNGE